MIDENVHPNIRFRIIGYHGTRPCTQANHPEGSFEDVKRDFPVGSEHTHVPPAPCRFEMVFTGPRDMLEERRQLFCRHCYPAGAVAVDRVTGAAAFIDLLAPRGVAG